MCSGTRSSGTSPTSRFHGGRRADKHLAAAEWIESLGSHPRTTRRCWPTTTSRRSSLRGQPVSLSRRSPSGRATCSSDAGDRAVRRSTRSRPQLRFYDEALALWSSRPSRAEAEVRFRRAQARSTWTGPSAGEVRPRGGARTASRGWRAGAGGRGGRLPRGAVVAQRGRRPVDGASRPRRTPPSTSFPRRRRKTRVLSQVARYWMLGAHFEDALRIGAEALAMARVARPRRSSTRTRWTTSESAKVNLRRPARAARTSNGAIELALSVRSPEAARGIQQPRRLYRDASAISAARPSSSTRRLATGERLGAATARFSRYVPALDALQDGRLGRGASAG